MHEGAYRQPSDGFLIIDPSGTLIAQGVTIGGPPATIPEPATLALAGLCILAVGGRARLKLHRLKLHSPRTTAPELDR